MTNDCLPWTKDSLASADAMRQDPNHGNPILLLPYHIARGALFIEKRQAQLLEETLKQSNEALSKRPSNKQSMLSAMVQHQEAMYHLLPNQQDPNKARNLWDGLLPWAENTLVTPVDARIKHYLSRLDYRDWLIERDRWRRQLVRQQTQRIQDYNSRREEYPNRLKRFEKSIEDYKVAKGRYDAAMRDQRSNIPRQFDKLKDEHEELEGQHDKLQEEREWLLEESNKLTAIADEFLDGLDEHADLLDDAKAEAAKSGANPG